MQQAGDGHLSHSTTVPPPTRFEEPWTVAGVSDALVAELARELTPDHPLFGAALRPVARRIDNDAVLFATPDDAVIVVVHLTWSSKPDVPPWPTHEAFRTWQDFERMMADDHSEHVCG